MVCAMILQTWLWLIGCPAYFTTIMRQIWHVGAMLLSFICQLRFSVARSVAPKNSKTVHVLNYFEDPYYSI